MRRKKMAVKELMELEKISQAIGNSPDLVQGGGGNTSVKLDDELMAVKASGYQLKQITSKTGFVVVNYKKIIDYYKNIDLLSQIDYEKDALTFVNDTIVQSEESNKSRPSVEAGFHAILKKYVIHTHSVYANILCCSKEGKGLIKKIFTGKPYSCIWIPYVNPGFGLTLRIKNTIDVFIKQEGIFPDVIFMENHGLVVNSDDCDKCIHLDGEINSMIKQWFTMNDAYPEIILETAGDGTIVSKTPYLAEFFGNRVIDKDFFDSNVLYPDQLVYLNNSITICGDSKKSGMNLDSSGISYHTKDKEARTMEETLLGYVYVINKIEENNLTLKTMPKAGIRFIRNWESEKYRKSLAAGR